MNLCVRQNFNDAVIQPADIELFAGPEVKWHVAASPR
jgi:hypothetical protein